MFNYLVRRIVLMIPSVLGVFLLVFLLVHAVPTDPARLIAGEDASQASLERIRNELGLDKPVYTRFGIYVAKILQGDFGRSIINGRPVLDEVARRFEVTIQLVLAATLLTVMVGLPAGIIAAIRRGTWVDRTITAVVLTSYSFPSFWIGLMLMWFFGFKLGWLPMLGSSDPLWTIEGIRHFALPAITLAIIQTAPLARLTRSSMLEVLGEDYIRTARAKGVRAQAVLFKHALRNAALPVITIIGMQMGYFLGGAVVIEEVFALPGVGRLLIGAVVRGDFPIVQGTIVLFSLAFMLVVLITDISYSLLNPRITYD